MESFGVQKFVDVDAEPNPFDTESNQRERAMLEESSKDLERMLREMSEISPERRASEPDYNTLIEDTTRMLQSKKQKIEELRALNLEAESVRAQWASIIFANKGNSPEISE